MSKKPLILRGLLDEDELEKFQDKTSDLHGAIVRQFTALARKHGVQLDDPHNPTVTPPELMVGEGQVLRMRVSLVWRVK